MGCRHVFFLQLLTSAVSISLMALNTPTHATKELELFPIRWLHLINEEMLRTNKLERIFRFYLNGMRSSPLEIL